MNIMDYKDSVKLVLLNTINKEEADRLISEYKDDFDEFLNLNLSPEAAASAILAGY